MSESLISIIIPTYNRADIIGETLDSIMAQTYTNWECIIVDDGSTDNTDAVINDYIIADSRFKFYKRPSNLLKGPSACRNYGFEKCNGDFVHFMDSDDLYFPYSLETYLANAKETYDVVVAQVETTDFKTGIVNRINNLDFENLIEEFYLGSIIFYVSGPFWKMSFLKTKKNLFDEKITRQDDWDFNIRMLLEKPQINILNIPLIKYRKHVDSLNSEVSKLNSEEINSHLRARKKIELLIKSMDIEVNIDYRKNSGDFYKLVYKKAVWMRHPDRYLYFNKLLGNYLKRGELINMFYVIVSFLSFELFGKGYSLLKKI